MTNGEENGAKLYLEIQLHSNLHVS